MMGIKGPPPQPPFRFSTRYPIAGIVQLFNFSTAPKALRAFPVASRRAFC